MAYAKIWTTIFNDEWFVGLPLTGRGLWLQMIIWAKMSGDTGIITFKSMRGMGSQCGCDGGTVRKFLRFFSSSGKIKCRKIGSTQLQIEIVNYQFWQSLSGKNAYSKLMKIRHKSKTKVTKNPQLPEQSRAINISKDISSCNSDHQQTIQYWSDKYMNRYGIEYVFKGGKDGAAIKRLLKAWGPGGVLRLIDQIFISTDQFYETGGGRTIGVLSSNDNKLAQEALAPHRQKLPQGLVDNLRAGVVWLSTQEGNNESIGQTRICQEAESVDSKLTEDATG